MSRDLVVITGASQGIGAACVNAFRELGHPVLGVDRQRGSPADAHLVADLADEGCGEVVADFVDERPVFALVNNAATGTDGALSDMRVEDWDQVLATNLRAPFLISRRLLPRLSAVGGSVVNVGSVHAAATSPGTAAYAASKGGLVALTRAMAVEWSAAGVRVNCVLPGAIDTPMLKGGLSRLGQSIDSLGTRHPLGRVGRPEEIAGAVVFLSSQAASFITGAAVAADGGALAKLSTE